MVKGAVGQHHFIRSFLPALVAVVLASALVLLGFGALMDRQLGRIAAGLARRVAPDSQVELEVELDVGELALAAVVAAHSGDKQALEAAKRRLDAAARAYDGWAHAAREGAISDVTPSVALFEERIAAASKSGAPPDERKIQIATAEIDEVLRANRRSASAGGTHLLDEIAAWQHRRRWEEMVLMMLLAGGCLGLMIAARRREERVCAAELKTMQSLERANADLDAFAGRVAHDLRNPLMPILSGSQVIERANVDVQVKRAAERIERSARRLASMIDMLLDFSRLTAGPPPGGCAVAPIVEEVVEGFRDKAHAEGVTIEANCEDVRAACEPIVVASPLQNLIENALKYGRRPGVEALVEVRGFVRAGMVILEVEDRGPGIDSVAAENLFRVFQRGVAGGEGIGLGLATARRLVEARGGSIGLRAGRCGGALFQIRIPAERVEAKSDDEPVSAPDVQA